MKTTLLCVLTVLFVNTTPIIAQKKTTTQQLDTEFFIPIKQSNLYTRVVGNPEKPITISLHSGPAAFLVDHALFKAVFEKEYLVVYFDQRGGEKSDECRDMTMLTTDQFVEDLDDVVDLIKMNYSNKKINLLGTQPDKKAKKDELLNDPDFYT